jgi:hypothetical protein
MGGISVEKKRVNNRFTEEEKKLIGELYPQGRFSELKELLSYRPWNSIKDMAHHNKLSFNTHDRNIYTESEKQLLVEVYDRTSKEELQKLFPNHTCNSLRTVAGKLGVTHRRIYSVNQNYFSTYTPNSCYWAGFLAADGFIWAARNRVKINLQEQDLVHLEAFKSDVDYTGNIRCGDNGGEAKGKRYCCLEIMGVSQWISDLDKNFNVTRGKSLFMPLPNIPSDYLLKCFIVGFIDGDGSIIHRSKLNKNGKTTKSLDLILLGNQEILSPIKRKFDLWYPPPTNYKPASPYFRRHCNGYDAYTYQFGGARADLALKDLSQCKVPFLMRKWNKVFERLS